MCSCLLLTPSWGPGLRPRHVSWLGIEPSTLWFTGRHSTTEPHQPGHHSPFDGHLGCFHILMIVNHAAMNTSALVFFQVSILGFFGQIPRSGITGSKGSSIFNFEVSPYCFSEWLHLSAFLPTEWTIHVLVHFSFWNQNTLQSSPLKRGGKEGRVC